MKGVPRLDASSYWLPTAPLIEALRRVGSESTRSWFSESEPIEWARVVARRIADETGGNFQHVARQIERMKRSPRCRYWTADEMLCALGIHPVLVYGERWLLPDDEEAA